MSMAVKVCTGSLRMCMMCINSYKHGYVYTHIVFECLCIYMYIYKCKYIHIYIYMCIYINVYICMYLQIHVHTYV